MCEQVIFVDYLGRCRLNIKPLVNLNKIFLQTAILGYKEDNLYDQDCESWEIKIKEAHQICT